jgi:hypothetical protein
MRNVYLRHIKYSQHYDAKGLSGNKCMILSRSG